ncbi:hypothetical protein A3732_10405, partial [Oleiphilus sp. HI0050]
MLEKLFSNIFDAAQQSFCRYPVVLSGDKNWCLDTVQSNSLFGDINEAIYISASEPIKGFKSVSAHKVKSLLGGDCNLLLWDGFDGLSPDGLGGASGLVRGGGLFIIMVPPLADLAKAPDPDYRRMCSDESELSKTNTFFLQRLISFFNSQDCLLFCQENQSQLPAVPAAATTQVQALPTPDQREAIELITHVVEGHRRRPLIVTADRGRGKTSALGIAAAKLALKYKKSILITAPSKRACANAFFHFSKYITDECGNHDSYSHCLKFISPDELLLTKPECQLLLIDEAAGIPASTLSELLKHYSRIVFSSTIHGYEGNGQGFAIRFKKQLDLLTPKWKSIHLSQPVRWAENDPLENWMSRLLFLSLNDDSFSQKRSVKNKHTEMNVLWPSQQQLASEPKLLEQVISLLVNAHYQTSPDDIRLILDHPGVLLACGFKDHIESEQQGELISAMLIIREGGILESTLQQEILAGKRRLRGHLVPQTLATLSGDIKNLEQHSLRIMRIAVRAEYENQGLGSQLIEEALQVAKTKHLDCLTTAFGLTTELLSFWSKNQFSLLKLGLQRDNASGCYAAIMQRPISLSAQENLALLESIYARNLLSGISRQYQHHTSDTLYDALTEAKIPAVELRLDSRQLAQLQRFASHKLAIEECMSEL